MANEENLQQKLDSALEQVQAYKELANECARVREKEKVEARKKLLAVVHDLRTPLAGISGLMSLLEWDYKIKSEKGKVYFEKMEECLAKMYSQIDSLLDD